MIMAEIREPRRQGPEIISAQQAERGPNEIDEANRPTEEKKETTPRKEFEDRYTDSIAEGELEGREKEISEDEAAMHERDQHAMFGPSDTETKAQTETEREKQKESREAEDILHRFYLFGLGVRKDIEEMVSKLISRGESEKEAKDQAVNEFLHRAKEKGDEIEGRLEGFVEHSLQRMNLVTKEKYTTLESRVTDLERRVEALEQQNMAKQPDTAEQPIVTPSGSNIGQM
jgi:polyhydroxyalkanoate synthesis regulator phasin